VARRAKINLALANIAPGCLLVQNKNAGSPVSGQSIIKASLEASQSSNEDGNLEFL
jgi:hypothetical protein